jgi:hypothetical protein
MKKIIKLDVKDIESIEACYYEDLFNLECGWSKLNLGHREGRFPKWLKITLKDKSKEKERNELQKQIEEFKDKIRGLEQRRSKL